MIVSDYQKTLAQTDDSIEELADRIEELFSGTERTRVRTRPSVILVEFLSQKKEIEWQFTVHFVGADRFDLIGSHNNKAGIELDESDLTSQEVLELIEGYYASWIAGADASVEEVKECIRKSHTILEAGRAFRTSADYPLSKFYSDVNVDSQNSGYSLGEKDPDQETKEDESMTMTRLQKLAGIPAIPDHSDRDPHNYEGMDEGADSSELQSLLGVDADALTPELVNAEWAKLNQKSQSAGDGLTPRETQIFKLLQAAKLDEGFFKDVKQQFLAGYRNKGSEEAPKTSTEPKSEPESKESDISRILKHYSHGGQPLTRGAEKMVKHGEKAVKTGKNIGKDISGAVKTVSKPFEKEPEPVSMLNLTRFKNVPPKIKESPDEGFPEDFQSQLSHPKNDSNYHNPSIDEPHDTYSKIIEPAEPEDITVLPRQRKGDPHVFIPTSKAVRNAVKHGANEQVGADVVAGEGVDEAKKSSKKHIAKTAVRAYADSISQAVANYKKPYGLREDMEEENEGMVDESLPNGFHPGQKHWDITQKVKKEYGHDSPKTYATLAKIAKHIREEEVQNVEEVVKTLKRANLNESVIAEFISKNRKMDESLPEGGARPPGEGPGQFRNVYGGPSQWGEKGRVVGNKRTNVPIGTPDEPEISKSDMEKSITKWAKTHTPEDEKEPEGKPEHKSEIDEMSMDEKRQLLYDLKKYKTSFDKESKVKTTDEIVSPDISGFKKLKETTASTSDEPEVYDTVQKHLKGVPTAHIRGTGFTDKYSPTLVHKKSHYTSELPGQEKEPETRTGSTPSVDEIKLYSNPSTPYPGSKVLDKPSKEPFVKDKNGRMVPSTEPLDTLAKVRAKQDTYPTLSQRLEKESEIDEMTTTSGGGGSSMGTTGYLSAGAFNPDKKAPGSKRGIAGSAKLGYTVAEMRNKIEEMKQNRQKFLAEEKQRLIEQFKK